MLINKKETEATYLHRKYRGKIEIRSKINVTSPEELSLVYTPGVADVCRAIADDPNEVNALTSRGNTVAVVTDGSAVLGLGDIGPRAALPVMEGKSILFKKFADIDAVPICLDTKDTDEIVRMIQALSPNFGGINLEDIATPRCFEIEERLKEVLDIPVFHDDQHGTAIVVLAALTNALKIVGKAKQEVKIVINGAGAAGLAIANLLLQAGYSKLILASRKGVLCQGEEWLNPVQETIALQTNPELIRGTLQDALAGADAFIGVSGPKALKPSDIRSMNRDPIVLALANPEPEIFPDEAKAAGAAVVGTGRSDFPNQVNNVLAFPGIFRGALDAGAKDITIGMKLAAAYAIADIVSESELSPDYIIPNAFNERVVSAVAAAVKNEYKDGGGINYGTGS